MIYDLQKASIWKRISAFLFDLILLAILVVGAALALTTILGYDGYNKQREDIYASYEGTYGVSFDITAEEYQKLSSEQIQTYEKAFLALSADEAFNQVYGMLINLTLLITTFSILLGYLILEFLIPFLLGNGQTLGKKIFGVAVMRIDGVKISPLLLFVRGILGKYTVETMIPVFLIIMIYFNLTDIVGIGVILLLLIVQLVMIIVTNTNSLLHDKLSSTVAVDLASQMIFDSPEELIEYKKRLHQAEVAEKE